MEERCIGLILNPKPNNLFPLHYFASYFITINIIILKSTGGPVVKNPPANAKDIGVIPDPRSHVLTAMKPVHQNSWSACNLEPALGNKRKHHTEKPERLN